MTYELNAYAKTTNGIIKFYANDEPCGEDINARYFHVTFESEHHFDDCDAHFNMYATAVNFFKALLAEHGVTQVYISNAFMEHFTREPDYDEPMTQEEEYREACMAEACGDPFLMVQYNERYHIEEDYSPSCPWGAPGMKVRDFI